MANTPLPDFITGTDAAPVDDTLSLTVTFEDNSRARELFGQYDEHLATLERDLHIEAAQRGNAVVLSGSAVAVNQAKEVLESLHDRIEEGETIVVGDVEGAIRHISSASAGVDLPIARAKTTKTKLEKAKPQGAPSTISTAKKTIHARTQMQNVYISAMEKAELIFGTGPAGTGKTYLAVAYAAALLERGAVDRIILSRPAVEAGERLGFLPGDMKEKVDPYLRPLYDALYDMMPGDKVERALTAGIIEIAPLAFMRGRTLAHAAVILDEAQNTTSMQMKMFLTRLGEGSKMIVTGDPSQIDLPAGQVSGLVEAMGLLPDIDGVEAIAFTAKDVVRHRLVAEIVSAYDDAGREEAQRNRGGRS